MMRPKHYLVIDAQKFRNVIVHELTSNPEWFEEEVHPPQNFYTEHLERFGLRK